MEDNDHETYELVLHGHQGDEFAHKMEEAEGDLELALLMQASQFRRLADKCTALAFRIGSEEVDIYAEDCTIAFAPLDEDAVMALQDAQIDDLLEVEKCPECERLAAEEEKTKTETVN